MGRLERKLDTDLIERIEASGSQASPSLSRHAKRQARRGTKPAVAGRLRTSYRGAKRNALRARRKNIRNLKKEQSRA